MTCKALSSQQNLSCLLTERLSIVGGERGLVVRALHL